MVWSKEADYETTIEIQRNLVETCVEKEGGSFSIAWLKHCSYGGLIPSGWERTRIKLESKPVNPLSAIWRIYPSSKWSSQWPYDGYICHGWMTSCGRGRDSATRKCFGRGSRGTIFGRSSILSLFFAELCPFWRASFFVSRAFERFGAKRSSFWAFGFDDVLEVFLKSPLRHRAFFANSEYDHEYFWKLPFFFSKSDPLLLDWQLWRSPGWAKHFGDGTSKPRMTTWLPDVGKIMRRRTVDRRRDWYESCAVIHGPKEKKKHKEVSVWLCEVSTLHYLQSIEFWGARFWDPMWLPLRTSLLSCMWMCSCRTVRLQRGESEESQSSVTFPVLITET